MIALMPAAKMPPSIATPAAAVTNRQHRTNDAYHDVADEPEAIAFHDLARRPAGNGADDQPDNGSTLSLLSSPR